MYDPGLMSRHINNSPLYKAFKQAVEHMAAVAHELHICRRAVHTLAIQDGPNKHVAELGPCAQEAGTHKVHHAPVFIQVILQWVASQH